MNVKERLNKQLIIEIGLTSLIKVNFIKNVQTIFMNQKRTSKQNIKLLLSRECN